jgi:magnesium transporter
MSKIDPEQLNKLDRRSTLLLKASRNDTEMAEKSIAGIEDPGMDALRGSFGAVGSMIRARSVRMSLSQRSDGTIRSRHGEPMPGSGPLNHAASKSYQRHQLYDPPVPRMTRDESTMDAISLKSTPTGPPRTPTIKFDSKDVAHYYPQPGSTGDARHEFKFRDSASLPPVPDVSDTSSVVGTLEHSDRPFARGGSGFPMTAPAAGSGFFNPNQSFDAATMSTPKKKQASPSRLRSDSDTQQESAKLRKTPRRNYPRTGGPDDTEESIGLVGREMGHPFGQSSDSIDSTTDEVNNNSIRLVTNASKTQL